MHLHEYQAKQVLKRFGVPVPGGAVAFSGEEALKAAEAYGWKEAVVKIQVHAGGRGKAGGVRFARSQKEIQQVASSLIGMKMVNQQTGPEGVVASCVLVSEPVGIHKEYYLSALIDRDRASPVLIASFEGGMDIEEVARKHPDRVLQLPFSFEGKLKNYQTLRLAKFMGWKGEVALQGAKLAAAVCKCFIEHDCSLVEVNPLVLTEQGNLVALDAKMSIDDNALFRQSEMLALYDATQASPQEAAAKEHDLAYIAMHGDIGCMVNGAGLAMATMDIIQLYGGTPANFLDVGGSATKDKVAEGFKIILSDPKVKAVLVNIFGGIMNCATIAEGVIAAAQTLHIRVPIIVRMEGTNVEAGKQLLAQSPVRIVSADNLRSAAEQAVKWAKH